MNAPKIALSILGLVSACVVLAQAPPAPPATPIDAGLSILLASGAAYGLKKIHDSGKK